VPDIYAVAFGLARPGTGIALACIGIGAAAGPLLLTRLVSDPRCPAFVFGPLPAARRRRRGPRHSARPGRRIGQSGRVRGGHLHRRAVTFNSLLQAETPPAARGRVFAAFDLIWQLGRLASLGLGGLLADTAGIAAVYSAGAALLAAAAVIGRAGLAHHRSEHEVIS
jgi:hypothetical protein